MAKAVGTYVFAGLFTEGMLAAGHDVIASLEEGDFGVDTGELNRPEIPYYRQKPQWPIAWLREQQPDIMFGNPACAGMSMASRTRGLDSPKNAGLKFANHLGWRVKPEIFVVESVQQLFQTGDPMVAGWEEVWQAIGYKTCRLWENAIHLGLPQQRKRVLFLASKTANLDFSYAHHFEPTTVRDAIGDLANVPAVPHPEPWVAEDYPVIPQTSYQLERRVGSDKITWHTYRRMSAAMESLMPYLEPGKRVRTIPDEIYAKTYWRVAKQHRGGKPSFLTARLNWDTPCPVLTGGATYIHPDQDRFLTVRETARLQGLSDSFVFSNFQSSYDEIGKAVSPIVGRWLGEQLDEILLDPKGRKHQTEVKLDTNPEQVHAAL